MVADHVERAAHIHEICHLHKRKPRRNNIFIRVNINKAAELFPSGIRGLAGHLRTFTDAQQDVFQKLRFCGKAAADGLHGKLGLAVDKRPHDVADEKHQDQQADQQRDQHGADAQPDQLPAQGWCAHPVSKSFAHKNILAFLLLFCRSSCYDSIKERKAEQEMKCGYEKKAAVRAARASVRFPDGLLRGSGDGAGVHQLHARLGRKRGRPCRYARAVCRVRGRKPGHSHCL